VTEADRRAEPPSPESLTQRQHARRDRIVATAVEFMIRDDYDTIQMKDVAAAAGVALGTLYRYFASKEHLFAEALVLWAGRFPTDATGSRRRPAPGSGPRRTPTGSPEHDDIAGRDDAAGRAERLKRAYRRAVRAFERHPPVYGHLLVLEASRDPRASEIFRRFAAQRNEAFGTALAGMPSPEAEDVVGVMSAVLGANLRDWALGRQPIAGVYRAVDRAAELLVR
jgi:AcrR family transcriptional regulator